MNMIQTYTAEDIKQSVKELKKLKPEYGNLLDLYEKIFIAQENSKSSIKFEEFVIPDDKLSIMLKEKFPLLKISEFLYDPDVSGRLFTDICSILAEGENEISESVKLIAGLAADKKINIDELFKSFINEDETVFDDMEKEHEIDKQILAFIIYNSLKPSLSVYARNVSVNLPDGDRWDRGYCPVCGSSPNISLFEENGKRYLICGFCSHKWESKRIYCPFCENQDHETLNYISIEGEEEHRVDVCDKCKKYIKTTDIKKTTRLVYPPLENQATPYIDLIAEKKGYTAGNIKSE